VGYAFESHRGHKMKRKKYTKELLVPLILKSSSVKDVVINKLGLSYSNNTRKMVLESIMENKIDIGHFSKKLKKPRLNNDLFITNSKICNRSIKAKIIKHKLIEYKCNYCGCDDQWLGQRMPLILDHINGINNDNRLENLRFLCSNCDSIQPTYKSKNKSQNKKQQRIREQINLKRLRLDKRYKEVDFIINNIQNSNINFQEHGWRLKVAKILNKTPQYCGKFIKENIPQLWEQCKKHNPG
jgi:5-methylcytosine-specific restriction endonuclease McrA